MKPASAKQLKEELLLLPHGTLVNYCLRLAKFKKENKELLSYLIFNNTDEIGYVQDVKEELEELFLQVNTRASYIAKKNLRKILRLAQRYIRYSDVPETRADIYLFICESIQKIEWTFTVSTGLKKIINQAQSKLLNAIDALHEDIQFEYKRKIKW